MSQGSLARRYAKAVLSLGDANQETDRLCRELTDIGDMLANSKELAVAMSNPAFPRSERRRIVMALAERLKVHALTANTLQLLLDKERLGALPDITRELRTLIAARSGKQTVELRSHSELSPAQKEAIVTALQKFTGKQLEVTQRQDPTLLGGVVAKVGDLVFDGSLRSQLRRLRDELGS